MEVILLNFFYDVLDRILPKKPQKVEAQGVIDAFKFSTDKELLEKISSAIKSIDVNKIKSILDLLKIEGDSVVIKFEVKISR